VDHDLSAFIRRSDLSRERSEQRPDRFAPGEKIDAVVTQVDNKTRKLTVSIKALEIKEEKEAVAQYGSTDSGASLGDILGAALDKAKQDDDVDAEPAPAMPEAADQDAGETEAKAKKAAPKKAAAKKAKKAPAEETDEPEKAAPKKTKKAKAEDEAEAKEAAPKKTAKKAAAKKDAKVESDDKDEA
jgi:small subunit ribosomal protein S1